MAGVDFNQLLGLITGSNEIVQNAGKTANGYKTILTNLMTKDLEKQFNEFELTMRKQNGELKSGYDMLIELGQVYNSLGTTWSEDDEAMISLNSSMNKLMKDIAGSFNINVLTAGFQNVETTINATESAMNSAGSATDEYAIAMDKISQKIKGLKGSFQELVWGNGGLQGLIKGFLDAGTGILQFINKTDAINVILMATGVIIGANLIPKLILFGTTLITNIGQIALFTAETGSLSAGLKAVGISASVAQVALVGLTLVISAGVMAWNALRSAQEEKTRATKESISSTLSEIKSLEQISKQLEDETLTRDALYSLIKGTDAYSSEMEDLEDVNELRQKAIDKIKEEQNLRAKQLVDTGLTSYQQAQSNQSQDGSDFKYTPYAEIEQGSFDAINNASGTQAQIEAISNYKEELVKLRGEYAEGTFTYKQYTKEISNAEAELSNLYTRQQEDNALISDFNNALSILGKKYDEVTGGIVDLTQAEIDNTNKTQQSTEEQEKLTASTEEAKYELSEYEEKLKDLDATLSILSGTSISGLSDAFEVLKKAQSEINETGELNVDTYESLMGMSAEYQALMFDESGALRTDEASIQAVYRAKIDEMAITSARNMIDLAVKLSDEGKSFADLANDTGSATKAGWEQIAVMMAELELSEKDSKALQVRIDGIKAWAEEAKKSVTSYEGSMGEASESTSKLNSEVKKLKSTVKDLLKERIQEDIDKLKDAQKDEIKIIKSQISAIEKLKDAEEKRVEDKISALEKEKDSVSSYYDAEIAKLQKASTELDRNNKLMELQQNLALAQSSKVMVMGESGKFEYQADEGAVASAEEELYQYQQELALQQQIESLQAMKDTAIASLDAQISKWEEYKTRMSENYQSQIDSLNTYKQTVQDGYEAQIEILENYKDNVEEFVDTLSEAEQRQLKNQLNMIKQTASNYETSLANLKDYVNKYNATLSQLGNASSTVSTSTSVGAKKYASGTSGVSSNEVAFVGDAPNTEMVVGSKANGTLMNLAKGTGVVNAESTKTFAGMLNSLSKNSSISGLTSEIANSSTNNSNANVVIQNVTLPSVTDPQSFMEWAQNYSSNMLQLSFGH